MAGTKVSNKRIQIDKATSSIIIIVGVASFVTVTSLMFSKALLSQRAYQSRVISAQDKAKKQLNDNIENVSTLKVHYKEFTDSAENIIGGSASGSGERDGDNARIVLDALPSKYDFPALATSLNKITSISGVKVTSVTGSDDELLQSTNKADKSVDIPITITVAGSYNDIQKFITTLEKSIRPFKITTVAFSGDESKMAASVQLSTYYKPARTLDIKDEVIK